METKYCIHCGALINKEAVVCLKCGLQVEELEYNTYINNNKNFGRNRCSYPGVKPKNKWITLALCVFLGLIGAHKFYEEKTALGILYLFTGGLFGIGIIVDILSTIFKPNYYYV